MGRKAELDAVCGGCEVERRVRHTAASVSLLAGPPVPPGQPEKPRLLPLPGFPLPHPGIDFLHHSFAGLGCCD